MDNIEEKKTKDNLKIFKIKKLFKNIPLVLGMSFLIVILISTFLLMLPIATKTGKSASFIDALFTASSSICVTGLVVHNTAAYWSDFGKTVILLSIQIGGLGTMTLIIMISVIAKRRIGLYQRILVKEQLNSESMSGLVKLVKSIIKIVLVIELIGAILLSIVFVPDYGWAMGIIYGIFHSISAFCNAGFDLFADSMVEYNTNILLNLTICGLIILGGLGFSVYLNIFRKKNIKTLDVYTKIVLMMTTFLLILGTVLIFIFEYNNSGTIGVMKDPQKFMASFFQSTITRTAGFYSVDISKLTQPSVIVMIFLMFIGGSPASTAGGIKTTTFVVLLVTALSVIRGKDEVVCLKRNITMKTVIKALTIVFVCSLLVIITSISVCAIEGDKFTFLDVLFECVSGFGTVGLTRGITPELSDASKFILSVTMFLGRVGPASIAFALGKKDQKSNIKYADGNIIVG